MKTTAVDLMLDAKRGEKTVVQQISLGNAQYSKQNISEKFGCTQIYTLSINVQTFNVLFITDH